MLFLKIKHPRVLLVLFTMLVLTGSAVRGQGAPDNGKVFDLNEKGEKLAPHPTAALTTATTASETPITSATFKELRALESFNQHVKTVHAKFDQIRVDNVMQDKVSSPGELWFEKPARFRCDYTQPQEMITLITDNTFYNYLPREKQVEYYKFASDEERDQQLHHLLIVFGFNADELARRYEIRSSEDDPDLKAELAKANLSADKKVIFWVKPRPPFEESCPFKTMKVTIDKASHLPEKIWYKDLSDADLTLKMNKVELDPMLSGGIFDKRTLFPTKVEYIDKRNAE